MNLQLCHDDIHLSWPGAISLERTDAWTMPWRIPHQDRRLFAPALAERGSAAAGVRIAFRSDTTRIRGATIPFPEPLQVDLCCDGQFIASTTIDQDGGFGFGDLAPEEKGVELWLPQVGQFRLRHLKLDRGATIVPVQDTRPRWITYGSSITQCGAAESPTQTWPAIVARGRGLNLTCLGYGGNCHLDPLIATMIRDQPADCISLSVGINIYGGATLSARTFRWNLIGFIHIIREKHPDTPLIVMSPIFSPPRESTPNAVGLTLEIMRDEVAHAVRLLQEHGDHRIYYVNGLDVLGPTFAHLLPDGLHPNAKGYKALGRNYLEQAIARYYP